MTKQELIFNEEKHTYHVGEQELISVTKFVSWFFPEFDKEEVSQKVADRRGVTQEEILDEWDEIAETGTLIHAEIEEFINGIVDITTKKSFYGAKFYTDTIHKRNDVTPEWKIFSTELGLAGTIDLFTKDKLEGTCAIVDWKTNEKLTDQGWGTGVRESTEHIPNSKLHKYYLQLNVYAYILQRNYGIPIDGMFIVQLREDGYEEFVVPDMQRDVENMIKEWRMREDEQSTNKTRDR